MQYFDNFKISFEKKRTETINFLSSISISTNWNFLVEKFQTGRLLLTPILRIKKFEQI